MCTDSLQSRFIVAAGSGSDNWYNGNNRQGYGTDGGGVTGATHNREGQQWGGPGGQTYQDYIFSGIGRGAQGYFGYGGCDNSQGAGSGGGWYGGSSQGPGTGGSSYVSGYIGCNGDQTTSGIVLSEPVITAAVDHRIDASINNGNTTGFCRITVLEIRATFTSKKLYAQYDNTIEYSNLYSPNQLQYLTNSPYIKNIIVEGTNLYGRSIPNGVEKVLSKNSYSHNSAGSIRYTGEWATALNINYGGSTGTGATDILYTNRSDVIVTIQGNINLTLGGSNPTCAIAIYPSQITSVPLNNETLAHVNIGNMANLIHQGRFIIGDGFTTVPRGVQLRTAGTYNIPINIRIQTNMMYPKIYFVMTAAGHAITDIIYYRYPRWLMSTMILLITS